tara:strand:+ start:232 stop:2172 length:1941 start_codon:yes stop_codon:yes gene_type:complete
MSQTKAQLIDPVDGTIVNADISSNNADRIAGSKINPVFTSNLEIQNNAPGITFTDGDQDNDFYIQLNAGILNFVESQSATNRLAIDSNGNITVIGNLIVNTGYLEIQSQSVFIIDTIAHSGDTDTKIRFPSADTFSVETAGTQRLKLDGTATVFNESGADVDFRIEGDTETNLFYVDAGNNRIGIGTSSPNVSGNGTDDYVGLSIIETSGSRRGFLELGDNQNADTGGIGDINFVGHYQDAGHKVMAQVQAFASGGTSGQRGSVLSFKTKTNGTAAIAEHMTIDSSGFIHQKFTSDNSTTAEGLFINNQQNTTGNNASLIFSNDSGNRKKAAIALIDTGNYGAGDLAFALDAADSGALHLTNDEKMRIDIAGRLLVGGSSSVTAWAQQNRFQVQGGTWDDAGGAIIKLADNNNSPNLIFAASRGSSPGTAVQNNDHLGFIVFNGDDGTDIETVGAFIRAKIDGTVSSNRIDTQLDFATHSAGSTTERVRIHPTGEVTIPSGVTLGTAIDNHGVNNTLDDYEEGTYVPTIGTGMNAGFTYTAQAGHYTKVGRLVRFDFFIQILAGTSNNIMYRITLPFACDTTGTHRGSGAITYIDVDSPSVSHTPNLYIGATYAELYAGPSQYKSTASTDQAGKYIIGGGTFHTAS